MPPAQTRPAWSSRRDELSDEACGERPARGRRRCRPGSWQPPAPPAKVARRARGPTGPACPVTGSRSRRTSAASDRASVAGSKRAPRFNQALLEEHVEGVVALSGCRSGEIARRLRAGDREGARAAAERYARWFGTAPRASGGSAVASAGFILELSHHLLPDDDWLVAETAALAAELGLPVVVTNDVHYALPDDRELHDVLTAIRQGRTLETLEEQSTK